MAPYGVGDRHHLGRKPMLFDPCGLIPDLDIYRSAQVLVKRHGQDAPIHAAMRADELLEAGDLDGYAVRKKIVKAGQESLRVELRDDE